MNSELILLLTIELVIVLVILGGCAFLLREQRRHYASLLADVRADNLDLRSRLFVSRGQPIAGTDMRAYTDRQEAERQAQRRSAPKRAPDPMFGLRKKLADAETERTQTAK